MKPTRRPTPEVQTDIARDQGADRPLRALIADDEPRARQFLDRLLGEQAEIEVVGEAKGGAETLALIARLSPDVVFLDIQMPDLLHVEQLDLAPEAHWQSAQGLHPPLHLGVL